jgi:hypothetical protein
MAGSTSSCAPLPPSLPTYLHIYNNIHRYTPASHVCTVLSCTFIHAHVATHPRERPANHTSPISATEKATRATPHGPIHPSIHPQTVREEGFRAQCPSRPFAALLACNGNPPSIHWTASPPRKPATTTTILLLLRLLRRAREGGRDLFVSDDNCCPLGISFGIVCSLILMHSPPTFFQRPDQLTSSDIPDVPIRIRISLTSCCVWMDGWMYV